jgi:SWI/SNF-related matrix-associated actin-dependent regulator 1 of chromatin subfamily A
MDRTYRLDTINKQVVLTFNQKDKAIINDLKAVSYSYRFNPILGIGIIPIDSQNKSRIYPFLSKWKFSHRPVKSTGIQKYDYSVPKKRMLELVKVIGKKKFTYKPRLYQFEALDYGLQKGSFINGDDVGIGKTFEAIMYAEYTNSFPCIVICPASVKYNWAEKWQEIVGPHRSISVIESAETKKRPRNWNADVVIINFDIVGKKQGKGATVNYQELLTIPWKMHIIDEAHFLKEKTSQRASAVRMMTKKSNSIIQMLSGTITMSRPAELWNLLVILKKDHLIANNWEEFIQRYCNGFKDKYSWNCSGATHLLELNTKLRDLCYLRREKREVLKELPPTIKTILKTSVTNLSEIKYASEDLISYLYETKGEESAESAMEAQALVLLGTLRKLAIDGKLKSIEQYLRDWKVSGKKLVVYGIHREALEYLSEKFKSCLLAGGVSAIKKQKILKEWISNDEPFLFANIASAGTGVDGLQKICSDMLILELPWRPSDLEQLVARIDRSGQEQVSNINFILSEDTIDKQMWQMLSEKEIMTSAANQGIDIEKEESGMKAVMRILLEEKRNQLNNKIK